MGLNSVGTLTAQMIVETEQGEKNLKKLNGVADLTKAKLVDVSDSFDKSSSSSTGAAKSVGKHNEKMGEGEKALRGFYREQKLQDRTTREAQNAIVGFTMGLVAMTSGMGEGSEGAKRFVMSLGGGIAAMQAAEFSAAGLGIAGKGLPGVFGKAAEALGKYSGTIGAVIGLGAALFLFFQKSSAEAKKAAEEGLKKYEEMLDRISGKMQDFTDDGSKARRTGLELELKLTEERIAKIEKMRAAEKQRIEEDKWIYNVRRKKDESKEIIDTSDEALEKLRQHAREVATDINSIPNLIMGKNPNIVNKDEKTKVNIDENLKDLNKFWLIPEEYVKRETAIADLRYKAGETTKAEYIAQLETLKDQAGTLEQMLELKVKIVDLNKEDSKQESLSERYMAQYRLGKITADQAVSQLRSLMRVTESENERLKIEQQIADIQNGQIQMMDEYMNKAASVGNLLQTIFNQSGDTLIGKMMRALQIVTQIAQTLSTLGLLSSVLSILGFGAGAALGSGTPVVEGFGNAFGKRGETGIGADREAQAMLGVQASIRSRHLPSSFADSATPSSGMVQEIRSLRAELARKDFSIHLSNIVTMEKALEAKMPGYKKYEKSKYE